MRWRIKQKTENKKQKTKSKKQRTENREQRTEEIIKALLKNRGLRTKREIEEFFNPSLGQLSVKRVGIERKQLTKALKRVKKALAKRETIIIYSDYDVDGLCGAAILWESLYQRGRRVFPYVPHRIKEGYGLSRRGIDYVKKEYGADLIITVDHGISAAEKIAYAKKQGIEVIVTDHHTLARKLPKAEAIVHTSKLSGSGVAYVFTRELLKQSNHLEHLELAALGTIADLVPLLGPNRVIAKLGLEQLNRTKRVGLQALIAEAGLEGREIGSWEVSFLLAPRINATGRLTHALDSLRLLCTKDKRRAQRLAQLLDQTNRERQAIMSEAVEYASSSVKSLLRSNDRRKLAIAKLLFVCDESYHEGVIGLVAAKLVEKFSRPTIVVSRGKKYSKASARSIKGFNIIELIRSCRELLVDCGGHPMAAGFTVETKHLETLEEKLLQMAEEQVSEDLLKKELKIDCEISLSNINWDLYQQIQKLQPFGVGNPEPVFASKNVRIVNAQIVGSSQQHLKLTLSLRPGKPRTIEAVAFGMAPLYPQLSSPVDIAYTISTNRWNGEEKLQLKVRDIKIDRR